MVLAKKIRFEQLFLGRLQRGDDLLEEITRICKGEDIRLGWINALGAVEKACIGYYDQQAREYAFHTIDRPLEITNLTGNISLREGNPMLHAHVTLADSEGKAYGGHLSAGTIVFACEFAITVLEGLIPERQYDQDTGLTLWPAAAFQ